MEKQRWERARNLAKAELYDEIDADIAIRYYGNLKRIAKDSLGRKDGRAELNNLWITGQTGVGKSTISKVLAPGAFPKEADRWWDNYKDERVVRIEDVDPKSKIEERELKQLTDYEELIVDEKGGRRRIRPEKVIITSQYAIEDIYSEEGVKALERRIVSVELVRAGGVPRTRAELVIEVTEEDLEDWKKIKYADRKLSEEDKRALERAMRVVKQVGGGRPRYKIKLIGGKEAQGRLVSKDSEGQSEAAEGAAEQPVAAVQKKK